MKMLFEFNMLKPILLNVTVATPFVSVNFILIFFKFEHVLLNFFDYYIYGNIKLSHKLCALVS